MADGSGRRSPSLDLIDRPPSLYRPPIRTLSSPRFSTQEVDELTNPNLPYRTGYTYAFSKAYRCSSEWDDYEVPNMAGTSFYHDSSMRDDEEEVITTSSTTSVFSSIYQEVITVYYKIITACYCTLATTYAGGRSIIEWIYYILYSTGFGVSSGVSKSGRWIGDAIYLVLSSIVYAVWLVLDSTGRHSYSFFSSLLQFLYDLIMVVPRGIHGYFTAESATAQRKVTLNEDDNEVRYFASTDRIVPSTNGRSRSAQSSVQSSQSVFGGLWRAAISYLKRTHRTHMEPVYELRSRTIEREVGDTDTDDELGIDEHVQSVHHERVESIPQRRTTRSTQQVNAEEIIYETTNDVWTILYNILMLPIDLIVGIFTLIRSFLSYSYAGVKTVSSHGVQGTTNVLMTFFLILRGIVYYGVVFPIQKTVSTVTILPSWIVDRRGQSDSSDSSTETAHHSVTHRSSSSAINNVASTPLQSAHQRAADEDVLPDLNAMTTRRRSRRLSNSSSTGSNETAAVAAAAAVVGAGAASVRRGRSAKVSALPTVVESDSAYSSSSSISSSSSESTPLFAPVGGVVWALKDSTTTILAKIIDVFVFSYLLIYQCFRGVAQFIAGGFASILSSIGYLNSSIASGVSSGSSGFLSLIGSLLSSIFGIIRDVVVESALLIARTASAMKNGIVSIWSSRPTGSTLCNLLYWLILLIPLILFCLWLCALPPFKKEHDEIVADYVKHASSIMEDYYSYGQHHTKSLFASIVDNIMAGARSIWAIFGMMIKWSFGAVFGLWESLLMFLAGLRVDRFFASSPSTPLPPPLITPPIAVVPPVACPPSPPPVYIPSPPSTAEQEALVAAIVAKVTAQMESKMAESLNGRIHVIEESVKRAEEELRAKITVAHEPVDYSSLDAMIAAAIRKYDSDKTGLVDFALESAGGQIVSTRCSETYALSTRVEKIFDIPLYYSNYGPRVVIQRNSQALVPGECWAFKGGIGYLTIKLAVPIKVSSVSYEHIPRTISRNGENKSAPKAFTIFTYEKDEYDFSSRFELGKFVYDSHGDPLQFFPVQKLPSYPVQIVEFQVDSNYGEEYTCLYRFRVHGENLLK